VRLLCLGEALIDFKSGGGLAFQGHPGGSPMNVAVAASRLGTPTGFLSQISTDLFGGHLLRHLEASGVDTSLLLRSDLPTALAFIEDARGDVQFEFVANSSADVMFDPKPRPRLPGSLRWLQFGSISLLRGPSATAITDIVRAFDGSILLDPNVRPTLIADRADYRERLDEWAALSDVVKLSMQDLAWLQASPEELADSWLGGRTRALVITRGGQGASAYLRPGERLDVAGVPARVVDTVGAGDSFTGALLSWFDARELPATPEGWRQALRFACTAAAVTCGREGADPPWARELDWKTPDFPDASL